TRGKLVISVPDALSSRPYLPYFRNPASSATIAPIRATNSPSTSSHSFTVGSRSLEKKVAILPGNSLTLESRRFRRVHTSGGGGRINSKTAARGRHATSRSLPPRLLLPRTAPPGSTHRIGLTPR